MPGVARHRRPNGSAEQPVRSVRVSDELWDLARKRAAVDGVTLSYVMATMLEGYAYHAVDLPKVSRTFGDTALEVKV